VTIIYLGELTIDTSDLADFLRGDDEHYVTFASSAFEVEDWAENAETDSDQIIVIYEAATQDEAKKLGSKFVAIERKSKMSQQELISAVDLAVEKLSKDKS
jgi:KaiC/GvpD/RAD55 family RecA-like ATPase